MMEPVRLVSSSTYTKIEGSREVQQQIRDILKVHPEGYFFSQKYKNWLQWTRQQDAPKERQRYFNPRDMWDGYIRFCSRGSFPTGLLSIVEDYLKQSEIPYTLVVAYKEPVPSGDPSLIGFEPRDYQKSVIQQALLLRRAVIEIPTNAGKTEVALSIVKAFNLPFIWITHLKDLFDQTQKRMVSRMGFHPGTIGCGSSVFNTEGNIVMFQAITRDVMKKIENFPLLVIDEMHHAQGGGSWFDLCMNLKASIRFGLSATPMKDNQLDDWKLMSLTGQVIRGITTQEMIARGWSTKPYIHILTTRLDCIEGIKYTASSGSAQAEYQEVIHQLFSSEERNRKIADIVQTYTNQGKRVLVLGRFVSHVVKLAEMIPGSVVMHGGHPLDYRVDTKKKFIDGKILCIVSTLLGEGVDIPNIDVLVFAYPIASYRPLIQRIGRGLRTAKGKERVDIIDFQDLGSKYLESAANERIQTYTKEGFEVIYEDSLAGIV